MDFPQTFGKYTLMRRVATGGMAEIFLARQQGAGGFEKDVVLKRLLPVHAENQEFVQMFLDEARIAAHLTHPNIAQIFDLGQVGDDYYIAMEYVHGVDLRRLCSQGIAEGNYLPLHHAVRIIAEVCDALAYAHARTTTDGAPLDIVHRDISPTNVLVTYEGGVKIVDFGIAKAANKISVTKTGQIKGKYGYMSPEQCRGLEIDARSDIFAVGINLYEITLGRRLFRGDTETETIAAIENGIIPAPRSVSPDYPERLERIVLKALGHQPGSRFQVARELQMALEDFLADSAMRATAGMLSEYMRQLFRDQLELEAREGIVHRGLARQASMPAATLSATPSADDGNIPTQESGIISVDSIEMLTSVASFAGDPESLTAGRTSLEASGRIDGHQMQMTRLPPELMRRPNPPAIPQEPSIDELLSPLTPSVSIPIEFMSPRAVAASVAETPPMMRRPSVPTASPAPINLAQTAPPAKLHFTGEAVDESDLVIPSGRGRLMIALVLVLLGVSAIFLMGRFTTKDSEGQPRIPSRLAAALPKVQAPLDASLPGETAEWPELPSPKLAIVRIDSEPQGARVVVNGNVLNASTPTSVQTFAGYPSTIRLMQPGFLPTEKRELVGDDGVDVKGTLKKGKPELAKLRVETSPPGAKIFVNGNEVGTTPLLMERVGAGVELTLKLELAGHYPHGVIFALRKEELREIGVQLMPDTGPKRSSTVNVESIPQGAIVYDSWIEGGKKALGKTGQFALKVIRPIDGGVRLRAKLEGYDEIERDLDLKLPFYTVYMRFPPREETFGTLTLTGAPNLTVYLGSQELGKTPLKKVKVPAGAHTVILLDTATGARVEAALTVAKDEAVERSAVLEGAVITLR